MQNLNALFATHLQDFSLKQLCYEIFETKFSPGIPLDIPTDWHNHLENVQVLSMGNNSGWFESMLLFINMVSADLNEISASSTNKSLPNDQDKRAGKTEVQKDNVKNISLSWA